MQIKAETKVGLFVLISILIFAYMAVHLGVIRFNLRDYQPYIVFFKDLNGLEKKADIKIAGVKVGWVENIELIENGTKGKVQVMILGKYKLYGDSYAEIHQDGLLGTKFLVLYPGSPGLSILRPGDQLSKTVKERTSIEDLMEKFEKIASNIQDVSESLKGALATNGQENHLKSIIENINDASKKIVIFTDVLSRNEHNLDQIFNDLKEFSHNITPIGKDIHKAADTFDKNFIKISTTLDTTMQNINSIVQKIDQGKGLIGKLVNEDEIYNDLKVVASGFKDMAEIADNLGVVVDSHFETMARNAEHYHHHDSKGYIDFRLYTQEDLFYMFQIIGSEKGSLLRTIDRNKFFNEHNKELSQEDISKLPDTFCFPPFRTDTIRQTRNTVKYGLQIGKIFKDLALRFGIFENSVGVGFDYMFPFCNDNFRWLTTFEAFDFRGQDRIDDRSPHLKWLNRVYFLRNLYIDFGADDFISKENANAFFGFGLRFTDEDIKLLLSKLTFLTGAIVKN